MEKIILLIACLVFRKISGVAGQNCPSDPGTALLETASSCFNDNDPQLSASEAFTVQYWNTTCSTESCLRSVFTECNDEYIARMTGEALNTRSGDKPYYWRYGLDRAGSYCAGGAIRHNITDLFVDGNHVACLNDDSKIKVLQCITDFYTEMNEYLKGDSYTNLTSDEIDVISRWAKVTYQCALDVSRTEAVSGQLCTRPAQDILVFIVNQTIPNLIWNTITSADIYVDLDSNEILSFKRSTVGVFGDPHLRVYAKNHLITCSSQGEQTYLSSPLVKIIGENAFVGNSRATSIIKMNIEFRHASSSSASPSIGKYEAKNSELPDTFIGGQNQLTDPSGNSIKVTSTGRGIRITSINNGYVFHIRRWKANYFFTLRMGDRVFNASTGLLVSGCSTDERLDQNVRRRRAISSTDVDEACNNITMQDGFNYKLKCKFDVDTSQDIEIAEMSSGFIEQVAEAVAADRDFPLLESKPPSPSSGVTLVTWLIPITLSIGTALFI